MSDTLSLEEAVGVLTRWRDLGMPPIKPEGKAIFDLAVHRVLTVYAPDPVDMQLSDAQAEAANESETLLGAVAAVIRKHYFVYSRNKQRAHETAMDVLQEVQKFYDAAIAAEAGDADGS